jgi:HD-GYP domain-containing protein (c-di-GMP phosphodiesterase class II)
MAHDPRAARLRLADILAALSVATDLGHGQSPETAMRVCVVATRLADRLGLSATERAHVYFASLLRHIGCTAYSHEEAILFAGEGIAARAAVATVDPANPREIIGFTISKVGAHLGPIARAGAVATSLVRTPRAMTELAASNCEVGSMMARRLDLPDAVQTALNQVFERWDGKGRPRRLAGESLSLAVRVTTVADVGIALADASDIHSARDVVAKRAGTMLDPEIASSFSSHGESILEGLNEEDVWGTVLASEPEPHRTAGETRLDGICHAFADMADLKMTFTRSHSSEVARLSEGAAAHMGLDTAEITNVKRAALFHDLGRVGIPNGVWEKPRPLSALDWERVRLHPYYSERILSRSAALAHLAPTAGMHHERQDGTGYHRQLSRAAIPMPARILAAADTYQAMTSMRPYRAAVDPSAAARVMEQEVSEGKLDGQAVAAVLAAAGHARKARSAWPDGLTDREIEVLRLISRGASQKDVGKALVISHRTAAHHIQHIYDKIGVSTRAAAAMYAMEHELLT